MTIVPIATFPEAARDVARRKIEDLLSWKILNLPDTIDNQSPLILSFPHRVFWVSIRDLRERTLLATAADHRAWRFLVMNGSDVIAAVQTWNDRGAWRVSSIQTGRTASQIAACLTAADAKIGNTEAEPCYLWCRAAWTAAWWLRPLNGSAGSVVKLPEKKMFAEQDFMAELRKRAEFKVATAAM